MLLNQWQLIIVWSLIFSLNIATSHKEVKTKHLTEHLENPARKDETLKKDTFLYICFLFLLNLTIMLLYAFIHMLYQGSTIQPFNSTVECCCPCNDLGAASCPPAFRAPDYHHVLHLFPINLPPSPCIYTCLSILFFFTKTGLLRSV